MKLFLRLFWLFLSQGRRSRCDILGPVDTTLRVFPNDLDLLLHVNNGVYLTYADLGRIDLLLRSGSFRLLKKKGWYPVAAGVTIEYRKSLKLWQRFTIRTRVMGWDEKSVYLEQLFLRDDTEVARMIVDARWLSRSGQHVMPADLLALLGINKESPPFTQALQRWIQSRRGVTTGSDTPQDKQASA